MIKYILIACLFALPVYGSTIQAPQVEVVKTNTIPDCNQFRYLVEKYDWDTELVMKIMELESSCDEKVVNDDPSTGDYSVGLMQINLFGGNAKTRPSEEELKDPAKNLEFAYKLYTSRGNYKDWSTYKKAKVALES